MNVHICQVCGYEYNARLGDPENGIEEDTDFEDLGEDWTCPLCGASRDDFVEEEREDDSDGEEF